MNEEQVAELLSLFERFVGAHKELADAQHRIASRLGGVEDALKRLATVVDPSAIYPAFKTRKIA